MLQALDVLPARADDHWDQLRTHLARLVDIELHLRRTFVHLLQLRRSLASLSLLLRARALRHVGLRHVQLRRTSRLRSRPLPAIRRVRSGAVVLEEVERGVRHTVLVEPSTLCLLDPLGRRRRRCRRLGDDQLGDRLTCRLYTRRAHRRAQQLDRPRPFCPQAGEPLRRQRTADIVRRVRLDRLKGIFDGEAASRVLVLLAVVPPLRLREAIVARRVGPQRENVLLPIGQQVLKVLERARPQLGSAHVPNSGRARPEARVKTVARRVARRVAHRHASEPHHVVR
eukprot:3544131-Prymnesium_polylepis.1